VKNGEVGGGDSSFRSASFGMTSYFKGMGGREGGMPEVFRLLFLY
jgi:hypothetical protein